MNWIRKWLRLRTILLLTLLTFILVVLTTTHGLNIVTSVVKPFLPGRVQITDMRGSLLRDITMQRLDYEDDDLSIHASNVKLQFSLMKLLRSKIVIHYLAADRLDILQKITDSSKQAKELHLPKHFRVDQLNLPRLSYTIEDLKTTIVGQLSLTGNQDLLKLKFISTTPVKTEVNGTYQARNRKSPLHVLATWESLPEWHIDQSYKATQGSLTIDGQWTDLIFQMQTHLQSKLIKDSLINVTAHNKGNELQITNGLWQFPKGRIEFKGSITDSLKWQAQITGKDFDPGQFNQSVEGSIQFKLNAQGNNFTAKGIRLLDLTELTGLWQGIPINGSGKFILQDPKHWQIHKAQFVLSDNQCHIQGGYQNAWNLNWQCQLNHLDFISTDLHGDLHSSGQFTGKGDAALADATLTSHLFQYRELAFKQLQAKIIGQLTRHQVQASWQSFNKQNEIKMQGALQDGLWKGDLHALSLVFSDNFWTLDKKAHIEIGTHAKTSDPICVRSHNQQACLTFQADPKNWSTDLAFHHVEVSPLLSLFALPLDAPTTCDLRLQLNGKDKHATGTLNATLSAAPVTLHESNQIYPISLDSATIKATLAQTGLQSEIHAVLNKQDQVTAKIALPEFQLPLQAHFLNQKLQGEARVTLSNLNWISAWVKELQNIQGRITGNLELGGTLGTPQVRGSAALNQFNADLKELDLHLVDGTLIATPTPNGINIQGSVKSGEGTLQIRGNIPVLFGNTAYMLDLTGNNILIANTKNYKVWANSNLKFKLDQYGYTLIGLLTIPKANASPDDFSNSVEMPQEVKYADEKEKPPTSLPFSTDLQLQLGDAVNINTHGLTGLLRGKLHIESPANQPTTIATGILTVDKGFYNTYGQQLTLEKGELLYTGGDILNPGMSIQAYRTVQTSGSAPVDKPFANLMTGADVLGFNQQNVRVGVKVTGTAEHPKVDLYSQPPGLSNSDILSYLIMNRPLSQVSRDNASTLLGAVGAMALSGNRTNGIYHDIQKTLGLDDLSLTTLPNNLQTNTDGLAPSNAAISIGKALSPKFHVQYTQGISTPMGIIQLRYLLSKRLTIQVESSQRYRALDILFMKER